jgi:hypothetical protein
LFCFKALRPDPAREQVLPQGPPGPFHRLATLPRSTIITDARSGASMSYRSVLLVASGLAAVLLFSAGCGSPKTTVQSTGVTIGQELQDLDAAREKGLISKKEYEQKRKDILRRK